MRRSPFNLATLPPWEIAALEYADDPKPIEIQGVRSTYRRLFETLDATPDQVRRAEIFDEFVSVTFDLHQWQTESDRAGRSIRNSYLRFLRGWGVDSNSIEGAVLKGWVESRLGLLPTFHKVPLGEVDSQAWMIYAEDRMRGHARTSAIHSQLDLMFEFCQYEIARRWPTQRWVDLYRGTYDVAAYETIQVVSRRERVVRLNSLSSFTSNAERAWEFGTTVWKARIPLFKILFFSGLLPTSLLKGEDEFLVIGGEYRVRTLLTGEDGC